MQKLFELQKKLDEVNSQILNLLVKRIYISKKIGRHKKLKNIPIDNFKREKQIYGKIIASAEKKALDKRFVKELFKLILEQSKVEQKNA